MSQNNKLKAIVCVDKNWGIGRNNDLLFHIKKDMAFFKNTTKYNAVIMGRKTFESLPNQKPLKDRINIVLSKSMDKSLETDDLLIMNSIEEVLEFLNRSIVDCYCIGGGSVYKELLPYCSSVFVTKVTNKDGNATVFFPNLDEDNSFNQSVSSSEFTEKDITFKFTLYTRKAYN